MPVSKRLASLSALALVASGLLFLPVAPASANPAGTGLVINEVYGAGGNSGAVRNADFIELYNPTDAAISLNGLYLHYRSASGSYGAVAPLPTTGSVPSHSTYLVQAAAAGTTGAALPTPDHVANPVLNLAAGGGQVFLTTAAAQFPAGSVSGNVVGNAAIIDMVGASGATTFEGAAATVAGTSAKSLARAAGGVDSDSNAADFTQADPTPTPATVVAMPVAITTPSNKTVNVGTPIAPITLAATGGKPPYTWQATGLPAGLELAGNTISGTPTTTEGSPFTVNLTVTDTETPAGSDTDSFTITVEPAIEVKTIAEIQGEGARSPYAPAEGTGQGTEVVSTAGVVTGLYKDAGFAGGNGYDGFTIQTGGTGTGEDTTAGSDGLFVYYGSNTLPAGIALGDSVLVTGKVSEYFGLTELNVTTSGIVELDTPLAPVTARATAFPTTDAAREALESVLIAPTGQLTVTNAYSTNQYGEVGLATGTTPLKQPSEHADATDPAAMQAIRDENAGRAVTLDDGMDANYLQNQTTKGQPVPYLTAAGGGANPAPPRVGARVTLHAPVVLDYRRETWKLQPQSPVFLNGADVATFEDTRAANLHPQDVGGDLTVATFNVLNYFNTTGEAYAAAGPQQNPPLDTFCTYYTDRQSNRIGNNSCGVRLLDDPDTTKNEALDNDGRGPRGAATAVSLERQETKLANAIEALDADVIALEEIENSIKLPGETNRDDAVSNLVRILNDKAGSTKWAYVRSPGEALTAAAVAEQDTIRPAFIYQVDRVDTVGKSDILFGTTEFANAREPLAQVFKAEGAPDADGFAVIVNHFKSKGDNPVGVPPATGDNANDAEVGAFNGDRKRQAARLLTFADSFAEAREVDAVFLAGDFNSYTMEEPIRVLTNGGFELVESDQHGEESYSYNGLSGSLDHVLGNAAAMAMVTGADIWEINSNEAASFQYSRYNYNVTDFWQPNLPFATSDHNPEIIGIDVPEVVATPAKEIQVLATNDFHGRLLPDAGNAAGAAPFATAVKELTTENPNSVFVAAGDLVGASTFESFIQDDEPTIDALNAMGLEVSAAGNHEFDRGYADFEGRIRDRAAWEYIATNIDYSDAIPAEDRLAETWTKEIDGVEVGFVGAVTEDLPALVNPAGITGITVTDVVEATNAAATQLKADGADLVVLLVHEGSPSTECSSMTDAATTWGNIVQNTSADVDAIVSGHTHLAYNCRFPVAGWEGRAVTKRPVVSAGQYGTNLNQLVFKIDETSGDLIGISQDVIATAGVGYAPDPAVQTIVDSAVAYADTAGSAVLGQMTGPFKRAAYQASGVTTENRGGESTLSNQVAEVQRWATEADIAFMNPGGLRADMVGTLNGESRDLTYRQAADVQPFANTLVNLTLTGAQIETVLEQQWQRNAQGGVPSRPFLRLGVSKGFTYTYVETPETVSVPNSAPVNTFKGEVTGMWLDGEPISPTATYSVTANSFLGGGGDNFWELANGTGKVDTGKIDLEAMVDYMEQFQSEPLEIDYSQRGVEVTFPDGAPESYGPGDTVTFDVASWAMSADGDATDAQIQVRLGDQQVGTAPVTITQSTKPYDNIGTATVSVQLPEGVEEGPVTLALVGPTTGTEVPVQITVDDGIEEIQVLATNDFHGRLQRSQTSAEAGAAVLSGAVKQLRTENPDNTVFAAAGDLIGASTFESFIQDDKPTIDALNEAGLEVSAVGNHELDKGYDDLINRVMAEYDPTTNPRGGAEWEYIAANLKMKATGDPAVPATFMKTMSGVQVGFVGAVTEDLPALVTPSGIAELQVDDVVDSVNTAAEDLKADGADVVVMLVHEGSPSTACNTMTNPETAWGHIVTGVNDDVDAIVSGHTHLAYNCSFPVAEWSGRAVTSRPVVSAGQYGYNLNQLLFQVDSATGEVVGLEQNLVALQQCTAGCATSTQTWSPLFPADPAVTSIVTDAVAQGDVLGAVKLGEIEGPFNRAKLANGTSENRGGESTLGNLVAEVQRWATRNPESGAAQIALMNPGGLRADMLGQGTGAFPRDLSYKDAAVVQPFANTLVNMDLTGAQIETVLEQQWQRDANNKLPSRPFLRLGVSEGFTYTYTQRTVTETPTNGDPAYQALKGEVTGMWLHGEPIEPAATYSVTVNSFLSTGGDNFRALANGTGKQDTGKVDLEAMVDYMAEFGTTDPVGVDYSQRAVRVTFPDDAPDAYEPGDTVTLSVASWSMSTAADVKDAEISVLVGDEEIGTAPLDNTVSTVAEDETGKATVTVTLPDDLDAGPLSLLLAGEQTGTRVRVPIQVAAVTTVDAGADLSTPWDQAADITVTVDGNGGEPTGTVRLYEGETAIGEPVALQGGVAELTVPAKSLEPGAHTLRAVYSEGGSDEVVLTVTKAATTVSAGNVSGGFGQALTVNVQVGKADATGTVSVRNGGQVLATGTVSGGTATVTIPGNALEPGSYSLTVAYGGDAHYGEATNTFTATVGKVSPTVSAGSVSVTYGQAATVTVNVNAGATGTVRVLKGTTVLGTASVSGGAAQVSLPARSLTPGAHALTAEYSGDGRFQAGSATFTATVAKAGSTTSVTASPSRTKVKGAQVTLKITVSGQFGVEETGKVQVTVPGQGTETLTLKNGKATLKLAKFTSPGRKTVRVEYLGSALLKGSTDKVTITVTKAKRR